MRQLERLQVALFCCAVSLSFPASSHLVATPKESMNTRPLTAQGSAERGEGEKSIVCYTIESILTVVVVDHFAQIHWPKSQVASWPRLSRCLALACIAYIYVYIYYIYLYISALYISLYFLFNLHLLFSCSSTKSTMIPSARSFSMICFRLCKSAVSTATERVPREGRRYERVGEGDTICI